jgi:hypothetical protein
MKDPENPYTRRAITYLKLREQEPENEQQYLWQAQVYATVAQAVELEQIRMLLAKVDDRLSAISSSTSELQASVVHGITELEELRNQL